MGQNLRSVTKPNGVITPRFDLLNCSVSSLSTQSIHVTLLVLWGVVSTISPANASSPQETYSDDGSVLCYIVTPDGRTLNLNHLCGTNVDRPPSPVAQTNSSDRSSTTSPIQQAPGCVVFDANGRPCPQ